MRSDGGSFRARARTVAGFAVATGGPFAIAIPLKPSPIYGPIQPDLLLLAVVVVAAALGRLWAGFVATTIGAAILMQRYLAPQERLELAGTTEFAAAALFALTGAVVSILIDRVETARRTTRIALDDRQEAVATLDSIVWTTPVGMAILDKELRFTRINRALSEMIGLRADEVVTRSLETVVPRLSQQMAGRLRHVFASGEVVMDDEMVEEGPGADHRVFLASYFPIRDARDEILGAGCTIADVTIKKRSERERSELLAALAAERNKLHAVIENLPAGLLVADASGTIALANPRSEEILGRPVTPGTAGSELAPRPSYRMDGSTIEPRDLPIERALRGETVVGDEIRFANASGDAVTLNVNATPIKGASGAVDSAVVTFLDVTPHVEAEQRAREESRIVETLYGIAKRLSEVLDVDEVVQAVTDAATNVIGAQFGAFFYNSMSERGEQYMLFTISGVDRSKFDGFDMPRNTPVFAPTFEGTDVVRSDDITKDPRYGQVPPHHGMPKGHLPVRSYLAVPVVSRTGDVHGGLFFGHEEPGRFRERDERVVIGIAAHAAVAIDNARLYEAERHAREQAEAARARLATLAEASRLMSASLDTDQTLRNVAALCVPRVADHCLIDILGEDDLFRRVAMFSNPELTFGENGISRNPPELRNPRHPSVVALATGKPVHIPEMTEEILDGMARNADHREAMKILNPTSASVVPLITRGKPFGTISFITSEGSSRRIGTEDMPLLEEIARRAAAAVENARMFARQRDVAETLQRSLLPPRLPDVPGLRAAVRYVPGGPGVEVGGDWYDVVRLPNGCVALAMGDVVGRGIPAAALMGQLRNALRAYAMEGHAPRTIATLLNRLLQSEDTDHFATLVLAILDLEAGTMRIVNAGHPPPVVRHPDGSTSLIEAGRGLPLGALARTEYEDAIVVVEPASTIAFYTDGLVEERTVAISDALLTLRKRVEAGPEDLDELAESLIADALGAREAEDDIALLIVRADPLGDRLRLRLPADPGMLAPLRATLRRWLAATEAPEDMAYEVLVACAEACTNAIEHALGPGDGYFELEAMRSDGISVIVRDRGTWRAPREGNRGRGLGIMQAFMDDVQITTTTEGTEVRMRRAIPAATDGRPDGS